MKKKILILVMLLIGATSCNSWVIRYNEGWALESQEKIGDLEMRVYVKNGVRDTLYWQHTTYYMHVFRK